ncbi:MAG: hypothetical protein ACMG6S_10700 [Byssovorax sp.]
MLLVACKSKSAPADVGAISASASAPVASAEAPPTDASAKVEARMDAGRARAAGPDFAAGECPNFDPDRWTAYTRLPTESGCGMFSPSAKDKLPVLAWEPCGRDGFGPKCRRLKLAPGERLALENLGHCNVDVQGTGPGRIAVVVGCAGLTSRQYIVADLDGPVTGALAFGRDWRCDITPGLRSSGWGADVQLNNLDRPEHLEDWEQPPRLLASITAARSQLVPTKHEGALEEEPSGAPRELYIWRQVSKSSLESAAMGIPPGIKLEHRVSTDGTDVVWSIGDRTAGERGTCSVFTGRWTPQPADVVATHVVDLSCMEAKEWKVRCGYAATMTGEEQGLLVRLKDGMTYRFPKLSAPLDRGPSAATSPIDLSCKELFLRVGGPSPNVFRVPLDALPEGTPPSQPPAPLAISDAGTTAPSSDAGQDAGAVDAGR